jgi:cyclophilin family peptidyl-prolyl cis-trans isomerase/HEAT repeat protein
MASLERAEPVLVALEDRRAYDEATLEAAASSPDAAVRARAALAAGRIGDERAARTLDRLLKDGSPEARESAAFGAGILGDPGLSRALAGLLADPEDRVAARAAWSLGFLEQPEGRTALLEALPAATAARRPAILFALWRFPTPDVAAAIEPFAADPEPAVRSAALYALSRRPQEVSLPTLTRCLGDPDPNAAALCARGLGILARPESIEPLGAALDDRRPQVVIASLTALHAVLEKNAGAVAPPERAARVSALSSDANPNLAVPALALLRFYASDREAFRRLWAAASTGGGRRRQVALRAAVAAIPDQAGPLLDAATASTDPFLRGAAASALGFLPVSEASGRRAKLIADPEPVVRLKVLEALDTPESIGAERALIDAALADPSIPVRAAALDLAFQAGGDFALLTKAVEESGRESNPDMAITAIGAAEGKPESAEARAVVEAAYRSPLALVSRLARRSLVRTFHADRSTLPWRTYDTGKSVEDYAGLLQKARSDWMARVETVRGTFKIGLAGAEAPLTVMNFVALAQKGYFDGAPIHRVVPGFVVQDGDPTGTGSGGPGYEIRDELSSLRYRTGTVGMALSGPDTGGSQWFVTQAPQPHLDGGYTVFGQILAGQDVVNRIEQDDRIVRIAVGTMES